MTFVIEAIGFALSVFTRQSIDERPINHKAGSSEHNMLISLLRQYYVHIISLAWVIQYETQRSFCQYTF